MLSHSKKIKMSQAFGSSITSITNKCSTWWEKLTPEKRSSAGIQQGQTLSIQIFKSMKFLEDIILLQFPLLSESKMSNKSVCQQRLTSPKKKLHQKVLFKGYSSMFQVLLVPPRLRRSESNICWEILKMRRKDNYRSKLLTRLMVWRHSQRNYRKWGSTWKVWSVESTDIITTSFKISKIFSIFCQIYRLMRWSSHSLSRLMTTCMFCTWAVW